MMIDSVIRHVEANAQRRHRGAGQAARRLRAARAAQPAARGGQGGRASVPRARAARRAGADADRAQAAPAAGRAHRRGAARRRRRGGRPGRRPDRPRAQDVGRSAAAAARRGRPGPRAARVPGSAVRRCRAWRWSWRRARRRRRCTWTGGCRPELEIACFRVAQESITNALRHASARHVSVLIVRRRAAITLSGPGRRPRLRRRRHAGGRRGRRATWA